jgi:hypothetical protein
MFTHQTILSLRLADSGVPRALPVLGHFRDFHFVRNLMETKQFLLRCIRGLNQAHSRTPDVIMIDAGPNNFEIKTELERWMEAHPQLDGVKVVLPAKASRARRWKEWIRRGGTTATTA